MSKKKRKKKNKKQEVVVKPSLIKEVVVKPPLEWNEENIFKTIVDITKELKMENEETVRIKIGRAHV